jgi:histidine triad (HIT) family protein
MIPGLAERSGHCPRGTLPVMSEQAKTIFGKILDGEIPCQKVYEDEHVLSFLDVGPLSRGHTLVIPKERKAHLHELSAESAAALGRVLPKLCRAVKQATGVDAYNVLVNTGESAGQVVMHVHVHIIPRTADDGLKTRWDAARLDPDDAEQIARAIQNALEGP